MSDKSQICVAELQRRLDLTKAAVLLNKHGFALSREHKQAINQGDDDEGPAFGFSLKCDDESTFPE